MVKVINFLKVWGVLLLSVIISLRTCSLTNKVEKLSKNTEEKILKLDSTIKYGIISKEDVNKMLIIEGLKSEKRMIQSTDRKMLDVTRQSEIDKEIEKLSSEK